MLEGEEDVDLTAHLTGIDDSTPVEVEEDEQPEMPMDQMAGQNQETSEDIIEGNQGAFLGRLMLSGQETNG